MSKGKYKQWLTKDGLLKLESWARDGLTDEQIAKNMNISISTLYNYKNEYLEIVEAMSRGKEVVDIEVENALLKRALGYTYIEIKTEKSDIGIKKTTTTKEVIPDTTAQKFWLKNRRPEKWRDSILNNLLYDKQQNNSKLYEALENEEDDT